MTTTNQTSDRRFILLEPTKAHLKSFGSRYHVFDADKELDTIIQSGEFGMYVIQCKRAADIGTVCSLPHSKALRWVGTNPILVSFNEHATNGLLQTLSELPKCREVFKGGQFVSIGPCRADAVPAVASYFHSVMGMGASYKSLPLEELVDVLSLSPQEASNYLTGGVVDVAAKVVTLYRGDGSTIVVPLSAFPESADGIVPDFSNFEVRDCGQTIGFGDYEASTDAVLYEFDKGYRARLNAKRRQEDQSFGAALRRLRLQKGVGRDQFGDLSSKTIARIERNEVVPRGKTLQKIADRLGVQAKEIESF